MNYWSYETTFDRGHILSYIGSVTLPTLNSRYKIYHIIFCITLWNFIKLSHCKNSARFLKRTQRKNNKEKDREFIFLFKNKNESSNNNNSNKNLYKFKIIMAASSIYILGASMPCRCIHAHQTLCWSSYFIFSSFYLSLWYTFAQLHIYLKNATHKRLKNDV